MYVGMQWHVYAYMGMARCMLVDMTVDVGFGMVMDTDTGGIWHGHGHWWDLTWSLSDHRLSYLAQIGARACTPVSYLANSEPCMNTVCVLSDTRIE